MNKALILRITGGVAALVGLLSLGHVASTPRFFDWVVSWISEEAPVALAWVGSWLLGPLALLIGGALGAIFASKWSQKTVAIILGATSGFYAFMWLLYPLLNSGFGTRFSLTSANFFETFNYMTGEPDSLYQLAAYATPLTLVVLGAAIWIFVTAPKPVKEFDINQPPQRKAPSAFAGFLATLVDSKLENFISRKVSGILYAITAWLAIVGAVLLELGLLFQLFTGNIMAFFAMLLVPVVTLLTLIFVRMAFEAGIALIVIAENTKK